MCLAALINIRTTFRPVEIYSDYFTMQWIPMASLAMRWRTIPQTYRWRALFMQMLTSTLLLLYQVHGLTFPGIYRTARSSMRDGAARRGAAHRHRVRARHAAQQWPLARCAKRPGVGRANLNKIHHNISIDIIQNLFHISKLVMLQRSLTQGTSWSASMSFPWSKASLISARGLRRSSGIAGGGATGCIQSSTTCACSEAMGE